MFINEPLMKCSSGFMNESVAHPKIILDFTDRKFKLTQDGIQTIKLN
jgi:hypothetical protein